MANLLRYLGLQDPRTSQGYYEHLEVEDLETGRVLQVHANRIRTTYKAAVTEHLRDMRQALQDLGIAYTLFTLDQPLDLALREYLKRRLRNGSKA